MSNSYNLTTWRKNEANKRYAPAYRPFYNAPQTPPMTQAAALAVAQYLMRTSGEMYRVEAVYSTDAPVGYRVVAA